MIKNKIPGNKTDSSSNPVITLNKKRDPHANNTISKDKERELENLFLMDGITPYQAARIVDIKFETARRYFSMWSERLISDPEYESFASRQKRVRARALEGYTRKIMFITNQRNNLEKTLSNLIYMKNKKDELVLRPTDKMKHDLVLAYNSKIAVLNQQLMELQNSYDAVDARPPADVILRQEMTEMLHEIQSSSGV